MIHKTQVRDPPVSGERSARPPLPPFTLETAVQKARRAEDSWTSRGPEKVALNL